MYYDFELDFQVDTGALGLEYIGSGVHIGKDITISLELIDLQGEVIYSDQQLVNNPLLAEVCFDILDTGGNVIYPSYKSGTTSRSITITALENEKIFGTYTKDFGIQMTVGNTVNSDKFTSKFYTYANIPTIQSFYVIDGTTQNDTGHWECVRNSTIFEGQYIIGYGQWTGQTAIFGSQFFSGSGHFTGQLIGSPSWPYPPVIVDGNTKSGAASWSLATIDVGTQNGFGYWAGEISGNGGEECVFISGSTGVNYFTGRTVETIDVNIELSGNPNFISLDRYEIYYATGGTGDIELPALNTERTPDNPFYLYTHLIQSVEDAKYISIRPVGLEYNTDYYFALVPYSSVGSGEAIYFGPKRFLNELTGSWSTVLTANEIRVENGDERDSFTLVTGYLNPSSSSGVIDTIRSGDANLLIYSFQLKAFDGNLGATGAYAYAHTQLKVVPDQAGTTGAVLYDEAIYNPYLNFYVDTGFLPSGDIGYIVYADNSYSGGYFKALRTAL